MMIRGSRAVLPALAVALLVLSGCTGAGSNAASETAAPTPSAAASFVPTPKPTSARDLEALKQLKTVAAKSADVDGDVTTVDCWTPSAHMIRDSPVTTDFKVICRVHYTQGSAQRYKDMKCIGDFAKSPMLTHCYRWAYHALVPSFTDGPSLASPSPAP